MTYAERKKFNAKFGSLVENINEIKLSKSDIIILILLPLLKDLIIAIALT